jgi:hypothetical protein
VHIKAEVNTSGRVLSRDESSARVGGRPRFLNAFGPAVEKLQTSKSRKASSATLHASNRNVRRVRDCGLHEWLPRRMSGEERSANNLFCWILDFEVSQQGARVDIPPPVRYPAGFDARILAMPLVRGL